MLGLERPPPWLLLLLLPLTTHAAFLAPGLARQGGRCRRLHVRPALQPESAEGFEPCRTPETLSAFEAWLRQRGGLDLAAAPVALRLDPADRSITLATTRPIERDQIVLAVPKALLLTTALPPLLAEAAVAAGLDPLGRLALRLLYEAAKGNAEQQEEEEDGGGGWLPYLRVLPRREDMHLPFLWEDMGEEEEEAASLLALFTSPLFDDVMECRAATKRELHAVFGEVNARLARLRGEPEQQQPQLQQQWEGEEAALESLLRLLDWRHWTWARAIAMSRPYILDPDEASANEAARNSQASGPPSPSPSSSSLTLIPVVDMADHCDDVRYAVQPGDGVFTSRSDVALVADRAYPNPGAPFWNTYGPGLSSAAKLYSFGYLETLTLTPEGTETEMGPRTVPAQGTALFVVGLKAAGTGKGQEGEELSLAKAALLASVGLNPRDQRLEVATRTRVTGGAGLAMVAIEDHVTAPGLLTGDVGEGEGEGGIDGGVERLLRYLRLKHLSAAGWARLGDGLQEEKETRKRHRAMWARLASSEDSRRWWAGATRAEARRVEVAAALDVVALCQAGLQEVSHRMARADSVMRQYIDESGSAVGGGRYWHRLGLVRTLLHGERLALRAVAEFAMALVDAAEREEEEEAGG